MANHAPRSLPGSDKHGVPEPALGDTGDVSNDGKEFKGFKEFELLRRREEQILYPLSVQVGGHRPFQTGRGAIP